MARVEMERVKIENNGGVSKLREKVLHPPEICIERGYLMTESYKETEGEPPVIPRAKALQKILEEMTIEIGDGELIVGRAMTKQRGGPLVLEVQWKGHNFTTIKNRIIICNQFTTFK